MLSASGLAKSHITPQGQLPLFRELSITLNHGESVALMGESGCGKSTLLHILAGLESADSGSIWINQHDLCKMNDSQRATFRRYHLGIIFQQLNLIPSLNILDNLAFQARLAKRFDPEWMAHLAEQLGIEGLLKRYPAELSGGQQQRVAIGRALSAKAPFLLADEPTGSLDEANAEQVMKLMLSLVRETQTTLLMVTHSAHLAAQLDRSLTLSQGCLR